MYLPASASIASRHAELTDEITAVDAMLYDIGDHPIQVTQTADALDLEENILWRILREYEAENAVRQEQRLFCAKCDALVDERRDYCDVCDTRFDTLRPEKVSTFEVSEPIARVNFSNSPEPPEEVRVVMLAGERGGSNEIQISIPDERRNVAAALKSGLNSQFFHFVHFGPGATADDLASAYQHNPTVLHLVGHGNSRTLSLLERRGTTVTPRPIAQEQLSEVLLNYPCRILLCLLNACDSHTIASHLASCNAVDIAIGWSGQPPDAVALAFAKQFYEHLSQGLLVRQAFGLASATACRPNITAVPRLISAEGIDLNTYRLPRQRTT